MASISAGNQTTLRDKTAGYKRPRRLYVFNDDDETVVWTGTVSTASPTRGQQTLSVSGSYETGFSSADIYRHMYVAVGSSAKDDDISKRVLLTFDGSTIVLDDVDDYQLSNGDHITIYNHYPVWPRLAYADYSDPANIVFYVDGKPASEGGAGIAYDEDVQLRPHIDPNIGAIIIREATAGSSNVTFAPDIEVVNPDASASTTITTSVSPAGLGTISTPVPGAYRFTASAFGRGWFHFKSTDSQGGVKTYHIPIIVEDTANEIHIKEFGFSRPGESRNQSAPRANVTITAPNDSFSSATKAIDWTSIKDNALVLITQEDTFGGTEQYISTDADPDWKLIYFGYVVGSQENQLSGQSGVPGVTLNLDGNPPRKTHNQATVGKTTAASWLESRDSRMTMPYQIYMSLDGYSTITSVRNIEFPFSDDTARFIQNNYFNEGDINNGVKAAADARLYEATYTANNRLVISRNLNLTNSATRSAATTTMTLVINDLANTRQLARQENKSVTKVDLSGGSSDGNVNSSGRFVPYLLSNQTRSSADGEPNEPDYRNKVLVDEDEGKLLAQRLGSVANQTYPRITLTVDDRYHGALKVTDSQWLNLGDVVLATDSGNIRAIETLRNAKVLIESVSYNDDQGTMTVVCIPEAADGPDGIAHPTPVIPDPTDETTFTGLYDEVSNPTVGTTTSGILVLTDASSGVYVTEDSGGTWTARN